MIQLIKLLIFIELAQVIAFGIFYVCLDRADRHIIRPLDLLIAFAIPVVGIFGHNKNVFYAFIFLIPLLSIGDPRRLVGRYLLFLPLFPALTSTYSVGSFYVGDLSTFDFFNLGALIALAVSARGRARPLVAMDVIACGFLLVMILIRARGIPVNGALRLSAVVVLEVLPPFLIVTRLIPSRVVAEQSAKLLVLGGLINAVIGLFESRRHWPFYQTFGDTLHLDGGGLSATLAVRAGFMQARGPVENSTTLGLLLSLALIAALATRATYKGNRAWLIMAVLAVGLFASQSRGGWIAAALGVALYLLYERRVALFAAYIGVLGTVTALVFALATPGSRLGSMIGRSGHAESTAEYRSSLLSRGIQEVFAHPLTGQTRGQLEITMNDLRQGQHIIDFVNTHLTAALTGGFFALAVWLIAWFTPLLLAWRVRARPAAHLSSSPVSMPFAMVGASFACLAFTSTIDRLIPLMMISVGLVGAFVRLSAGRYEDARVGRASEQPSPRRWRVASRRLGTV